MTVAAGAIWNSWCVVLHFAGMGEAKSIRGRRKGSGFGTGTGPGAPPGKVALAMLGSTRRARSSKVLPTLTRAM